MSRLMAHACSCGCVVTLSTSDDGVPQAWGVLPVNNTAEMDQLEDAGLEGFLERAYLNRATFTQVTVCDCGRRYRALDGPPWIAPALDAVSDS